MSRLAFLLVREFDVGECLFVGLRFLDFSVLFCSPSLSRDDIIVRRQISSRISSYVASQLIVDRGRQNLVLNNT